MYKAAAGNMSYEIVPSDNGFVVNGKEISWDLVQISHNSFHILFENRSYRAEIVKADHLAKTFTVKIDNRPYTIEVKTKFELLLEKMGMNTAQSTAVNAIKAPMPGLIIALKVNAGDTVLANEPLLILEAMKMENVIKSPGNGTVKTVKVKKGDNVEKNQVLIEF